MDLIDSLRNMGHSNDLQDPSHKWFDAADVIDLQTKDNYIVQRCEGCPMTKRKRHG